MGNRVGKIMLAVSEPRRRNGTHPVVARRRAPDRHFVAMEGCPLLGVKRTCLFALHMSAYDPKRTSLALVLFTVATVRQQQNIKRRRGQ